MLQHAALQEIALYLYENQNIDFDDVRASIERLFGPGHSAVIHDGDAAVLLDCISGNYCAGTVHDPSGNCAATFAIDYVTREIDDSTMLRDVVGLHIGPRGYWCRSVKDGDAYDRWREQLSKEFSLNLGDV